MLALGVLTSSSAMAQVVPVVECLEDDTCNDGDIFTMNWCDLGRCQGVHRRGDECTESEWSWCFWDDQCDDGNARTVDWCDFGTCRNHARRARPNLCVGSGFCDFDSDCEDGDAGTVTWCHEQSCRVVHREDPACQEWAIDCNTDEECTQATDRYKSILVSWCQEQKCHVTRIESTDECLEIGNIKPDY